MPKKYAVEQVVTKIWVPQATGYRINGNIITIMCIAYDSVEDARENDHSKKVGQEEHSYPIHGNEKINISHYIAECAVKLGGTQIDL